MVKPYLEHGMKVVEALSKGARRPQTLPAQFKELASGVVTGALYPWGYLDAGPGGRVRTRTLEPASDTPVLLVHGYLANKSNWYVVERELRSNGFDQIHAMNYSPRHADIDRLADVLVLRAHEVMAATRSDRIHLVGHSLGGLIIRTAVQSRGLDAAVSAVTIATPHGGVDLAKLGPVVGTRNMIGLQLQPGSPWLRHMWAESHAMADTRFIAYYSNLDLLVPGRRAMMLEPELAATNILMKDHGHLSVMLAGKLARSVADQLAAVDGREGFGRPVSGLPGPSSSRSQPESTTRRRRA